MGRLPVSFGATGVDRADGLRPAVVGAGPSAGTRGRPAEHAEIQFLEPEPSPANPRPSPTLDSEFPMNKTYHLGAVIGLLAVASVALTEERRTARRDYRAAMREF